MVLSKAASPHAVASRRPVGRPVGSATVSIEARARRDEAAEAWGRVIHLGHRIHTAVIAERGDVIQQAAGELVHIGQRRLRQMGPSDAA